MHLSYAVRHPLDSVERARGRLDTRSDHRALAARSTHDAARSHEVDPGQQLHAALGLPWPCPAAAAFDAIWDAITAELAAGGTRVGLASYRGWNDGDRAMGEAVWCLVAHLRPRSVLETGVAHGLTSRIVLEGLARAGSGQLWSIDLPAVDPALHPQIGAAVPARLSGRWTYVAGISRRRLPGILDELREVDLFIHDSLHTTRNTCFELMSVWPVLRSGGVAVVDDIHRNLAFDAVVRDVRPRASFTADHVLGDGRWGVLVKRDA